MNPQILLSFLLCIVTQVVAASPRDDLGSSSQQVRDDAAKILRESYKPPARTRWEPLLAKMRPGITKEKVLELLAPFNATAEEGNGSGQSSNESYRLDDLWQMSCTFLRSGAIETVFKASLVERLRHIWVAPKSGFTGVWTTYFVNGQRSHEIHYVSGKYEGDFTAFHSNGKTAYVQHYGPSGVFGENAGYFPSGRIMYQGRYLNGEQVGTWTHYNEDGSVRSTTQHMASEVLKPHPKAVPNIHRPGEVDRPEMVKFIVTDPASLPGIVVDETAAQLVGEWQYSTHTPPYVGLGYLHDMKAGKGAKYVTFTPELPKAGWYEVRLAHCYNVRRSTKTPVTIHHADGDTKVVINQQQEPEHGRLFRTLGTFRFEAGRAGWVRVSNEGTEPDKVVIADAVQFLPVAK